MRLYKNHDFPGKLLVVEGVDGSGKSTQLDLLRNWLEAKGQSVIFTEWNSSPLISKTIKKAKQANSLIPVTFSLLHATDFADRLENIIVPALKAGLIVLADRYCYTAFARDVADTVIFMDGGVIVEQGDAKQVIENPQEERTRQFLSRFSQN